MLDASAGLSALLHIGPARTALATEQVHVPHLADVEIAQALRRMARSATIAEETAHRALTTWSELGLVRHAVQPLLERVWELRDNVTAYDAGYAALAEVLGCPLLTADARMARAGVLRCPVTVVPR